MDFGAELGFGFGVARGRAGVVPQRRKLRDAPMTWPPSVVPATRTAVREPVSRIVARTPAVPLPELPDAPAPTRAEAELHEPS